MGDILLVGGTGSGKTTLAEALVSENPGMNYIYMSKYAVRIPMSLIATTHPHLLSLSKFDYIQSVFANKDVECTVFFRQEMDEFVERISDIYGSTFIAELALDALVPDRPNIVDNAPKAENVRFLKENGLYVVSLHCKPETQLQRRLNERKKIDPSDEHLLRRQIEQTNRYFEIEETRKLADVVYDTDKIGVKDYREISREIIKVMQ